MAAESLQIGALNDLVTGDLQVDYTAKMITGSLDLAVLGVETPVLGLTLGTAANGDYTIAGTTVAGTGVSLQFANQAPTSLSAVVSALNQPVVTVTEAVASNAVCFVAGTRIRTMRGYVPVETLAIGDLVITASGETRPIKWLGHRSIDCRGHRRPEAVLPVRIAAHALAPNKPERDLFVSPGHAICVDLIREVLIPMSSLINGATIAQVQVDEVTYWHVELESHDILLAENLPAESYLDIGNRAFFVESGTVSLEATPDAPVATHAGFCRPFHIAGPLVDVVRDQVHQRALELGWTMNYAPLADLHLEVDGVRVEPEVGRTSVKFVVSGQAQVIWLRSESSIPRNVGIGPDPRQLGVCVAALTIDDGLDTRRLIASDDARLCVGFHDPEPGVGRWTAGSALLPSALWEGSRGLFFLGVDLSGSAVPRWVAPTGVKGTVSVHEARSA